jgi:hypothetical protein
LFLFSVNRQSFKPKCRDEQRYWIHPVSLRLWRASAAIDWFLGRVIDKQIEVVNSRLKKS